MVVNCRTLKENFTSAVIILGYSEYSEERRRPRIRRRELRDAANPLEMPEDKFRHLFRISREICHALCVALDGRLRRRRSNGLPVHVQVLGAIRFYATGGYQASIGQDGALSLSQTCVSKCIRSVSRAICTDLLPLWIKFPVTEHDRQAVIERFLTKSNFPCVLGCIGCTHISVVKPRHGEESFKNCHGYHSLNVQMVCDQDLRILACFSKYPGAVHNQFIFDHSKVKAEMLRLHTNGERVWLLGDSGYEPEPFLLTPIRDVPYDSPEGRYNQAHGSTRNCMEQAIGVLKTRWRCLLHRRALHVSPSVAVEIIYSCVVLHNMILHHGLALPENIIPEAPLPEVQPNPSPVLQGMANGIQARQCLILEHFQQE